MLEEQPRKDLCSYSYLKSSNFVGKQQTETQFTFWGFSRHHAEINAPTSASNSLANSCSPLVNPVTLCTTDLQNYHLVTLKDNVLLPEPWNTTNFSLVIPVQPPTLLNLGKVERK